MKTAILFLLFFYCGNVMSATAGSFFDGKYPSLGDFEEQSIQLLRNYFYAFSTKSIIQGKDHLYQFSFQNDEGTIIQSVMARIERTKSEEGLTEKVFYLLPNGQNFIYSLFKKNNFDETPDMDLLTFKYDIEGTRLTLNVFNSWFDNTNSETGMISLGFMEITTKVETSMKDQTAKRSYSLFYKNMNPAPQATLNVEAYINGNTVNFKHSVRGEELTPKTFFQGLNESASIYFEFSRASLMILYGMGFPVIEEVN